MLCNVRESPEPQRCILGLRMLIEPCSSDLRLFEFTGQCNHYTVQLMQQTVQLMQQTVQLMQQTVQWFLHWSTLFSSTYDLIRFDFT